MTQRTPARSLPQPKTGPDMRWLATCMQTLFLTTPLSQPVNTSITVSE